MHPVLNKGERSGKKRPQAMQIDMEIFAPKNNQCITITIQKTTNSRSIQPTANKIKSTLITRLKSLGRA
jgi:hypothetical protein